MIFQGMTLIEVPPFNGIYVGVVDLDRELALQLLELNTHNRKIRPLKVAELDRTLNSGHWRFNGEAVKFDTDAVMSDGQHRCQAIADGPAGVAYPTLVVFGVAPEAQETMDQGTRRGAYEQLQLAGVDADTTIAAAVRLLIRWDEGAFFRDWRTDNVTRDDIVAWAKQHPAAMARLREFGPRGYRHLFTVPPSVALAIAYRLHEIDDEWACRFFDAVRDGEGLHRGDPSLALRKRLLRLVATREKQAERDWIAYFVMAWNAFRDHRDMVKLQGPRGGAWTAATFPQPI